MLLVSSFYIKQQGYQVRLDLNPCKTKTEAKTQSYKTRASLKFFH